MQDPRNGHNDSWRRKRDAVAAQEAAIAAGADARLLALYEGCWEEPHRGAGRAEGWGVCSRYGTHMLFPVDEIDEGDDDSGEPDVPGFVWVLAER